MTEREPPKIDDNGYELRTHDGKDIVIGEDEELCRCDGDGREWDNGAAAYSNRVCRYCHGEGKRLNHP